MTEVYQGSCLCAAVRYELLDEPKAVSHCHCSQCRKGHGAAFASYGSVPCSAFSLLSCAEDHKAYRSSESVLREFCRHCGSTLFWKCSQGEAAGWLCVALGHWTHLSSPVNRSIFTPATQQSGSRRLKNNG